ncbi:menaquinone biosynthetic enzyme MqnA/MqnD family protein [Streptomyces mirabilis]|uniref:menaquinone biosynthetic enzyme MqnA/MqnD family protein n=1 Tax=Streptomyces mirabilis TaxID=68239 RepID=UPI003661E4DA
MDQVRVGHIKFLNCYPLQWGLARAVEQDRLRLFHDTPENLSDALLAGALDISPITCVEYLRNAEGLQMLQGIAIGSNGPVMSCVIVSRLPLSQLSGKTVALGSTSRTSVRLAQLLLEQCHGVRAAYVTCPPDLTSMMRSADAAVLIGDTALKANLFDAPRLGLEVHDLGAMWKEWTGLPFVFAVWATRREFAKLEPQALREVHQRLLTARDVSLQKMTSVAAEAALVAPFSADVLERYFTAALDYSLGDAQLAGIAEFARRIGHDGSPRFTLGPSTG